MPDTILPRRDQATLPTVADLIRAERRPLPSHSLDAVNYRCWAAAVLAAEVRHRSDDFTRAATKVGAHFDRYLEPACVETGQLAHECHAGAALNWLIHLQAHESMRTRTYRGFREWSPAEQRQWLERRRYLWSGFLRQVKRYRDARALVDRPVMREAA